MRSIQLNLPNCEVTEHRDFSKEIEDAKEIETVLFHTLRAHDWGMFKIESAEKYFELRRLVKRAQLIVAFYEGMEPATITMLWESHEKDIEREAAGIYW